MSVHPVPTPEQMLRTTELMAQLSPDELAELTDRMRHAGRNLANVTPDEVAEWIDAMGPAIAAAAQPEPASSTEDWSELEEFLDDTLLLRYQGSEYRLQAADIDTGLECQLLLGVGARLRAGGKVSQRQRDQLEDAEETELFIRLLGGQQWLTEPLEQVCPVCAMLPGEPCVSGNGEGEELEELHKSRGVPDPRYRPDRDVWAQLQAERRSWAFVQHVGTTAIFWAAFGSEAAYEFWKSGGRPKAPAPLPPAPKVPQDRKAPATTTPARASGSSTPRKPRAARKGTGGRKSSSGGA